MHGRPHLNEPMPPQMMGTSRQCCRFGPRTDNASHCCNVPAQADAAEEDRYDTLQIAGSPFLMKAMAFQPATCTRLALIHRVSFAGSSARKTIFRTWRHWNAGSIQTVETRSGAR